MHKGLTDGAIIMTRLESAAGSAVISGERGQSNCGRAYYGDSTRDVGVTHTRTLSLALASRFNLTNVPAEKRPSFQEGDKSDLSILHPCSPAAVRGNFPSGLAFSRLSVDQASSKSRGIIRFQIVDLYEFTRGTIWHDNNI